MADTLRIKRRLAGGAAGAPTSLKNAELAYNEQDDTLYYGKGDSSGNAVTVIPIGGPGAFQPKDPDLTSIASYAGTGLWLYRSAADTWSPITIGAGLDFTAGTLKATGSGGGIAEPVGDGFYGRNMASSVGSWVAAVKKAGDTMTGALNVGATAGVELAGLSSAGGQARLVAGGTNTDVGWFCTTKGTGGAWYFYTNSFANVQVQIVHQTTTGMLVLAGGDGSVIPNLYKSDGSNVKTQTPAASSNDTSIATTAFVQASPGIAQGPTTTRITAQGAYTYNPPAGCKWIRIKACASGGGGATTGGAAGGGAGGNLTFVVGGTTAYTLGGGVGGNSVVGGAGGTVTQGTLPSNWSILCAITGGQGHGAATIGNYNQGGAGGTNSFGGSGAAGGQNVGGGGIDGTGAGGGGGGWGGGSTVPGGGGGGSGAYGEFIVRDPGQITGTIGARGAAGAFGGQYAGGQGGLGAIYIEEHYNY
ncbi:MAG TPA: hypothetical protein VH482_31995 [Thermomicrobiales bacterium]